jgi:NAD(P)-dependent dehydrogenase (short-subunit alcohol dehydrogenase family)
MLNLFFVTGAGRGTGIDLARAGFLAGHQVVATGRVPDAVAAAVGSNPNLLTAKLEVTSRC